MVAAGAAAIVIAGGSVAAAVLLSGGSGGNSGSTTGTGGIGSGSYVASGPWRLRVDDRISGQDNGCTVTLTDTHSGSPILLPKTPSRSYMFQIHQAGSFRWQVNDPGCVVVAAAGPGSDKLPLAWDQPGDSDAFTAPANVAVQVTDSSSGCTITLSDPANGQPISFQHAERGKANDTVELSTGGHTAAYLSDLTCAVRVSAAPETEEHQPDVSGSASARSWTPLCNRVQQS
jgi:eukaryotic-like serine/threonine-protein kinase